MTAKKMPERVAGAARTEDQIVDLFGNITDACYARVHVGSQVRAGIKDFLLALDENMTVRDAIAALEGGW
jgi:hypothetical protein